MIAESQACALALVREQLGQATAAIKCHGCGCMLHTVEALEKAAPAIPELSRVLDEARRVLVPQKYDCLGCEVCFPALAANASRRRFLRRFPMQHSVRPRSL